MNMLYVNEGDKFCMFNSQTEVKFLSIYVEENQGWFSATYFNALFCVDLLTGKTEYIGYFPKEEAIDAYRNIVPHNQYLFFIPYYGSTLGIYDKNTKNIITIAIPADILNKLCNCRFSFAYVYGDCLYMYGKNSAIIVEYNIISQSFTLIDVFKDGDDTKEFSSPYHLLVGGKIYTLINDNSIIIEISPGNLEFTILNTNNIKRNICSFIEKKGRLWIVDTAGELYEYDLAEKNCRSYGLVDRNEKWEDNSGFFWSMYEYHDKIYMVAMYNHVSYVFDTISKTCQENKNFKIEPHRKFQFWTNEMMPIWFLSMQCNGMLYFQWEADLTLRILDLRNNQLKTLPVLIDKEHYCKALMKRKLERDGLVVETEDDCQLELYLDELRIDFDSGME